MTDTKAPKTYITPRGFQRLLKELQHLRSVERPHMVNEVADAAAQGDRSENASYIYGKKRLREIDRRMRYLARCIDASLVVDPLEQRTDRVFFGVVVKVEDEDEDDALTYQIVGPDDETSSRCISYRSPIGAALLGHRVDDEFTVETPKGDRTLIVLEINRPEL